MNDQQVDGALFIIYMRFFFCVKFHFQCPLISALESWLSSLPLVDDRCNGPTRKQMSGAKGQNGLGWAHKFNLISN